MGELKYNHPSIILRHTITSHLHFILPLVMIWEITSLLLIILLLVIILGSQPIPSSTNNNQDLIRCPLQCSRCLLLQPMMLQIREANHHHTIMNNKIPMLAINLREDLMICKPD
jgi:hypothetical protein